jgi:hypothetical protein
MAILTCKRPNIAENIWAKHAGFDEVSASAIFLPKSRQIPDPGRFSRPAGLFRVIFGLKVAILRPHQTG